MMNCDDVQLLRNSLQDLETKVNAANTAYKEMIAAGAMPAPDPNAERDIVEYPPTARGTWVLNETIVKPITAMTFALEGTAYTGELKMIALTPTPSSAPKGYFRVGKSNRIGIAGYLDEWTPYADPTTTAGYLYVAGTASSGLIGLFDYSPEIVTFTITGGEDAEDPDLVAWLEASATRIS